MPVWDVNWDSLLAFLKLETQWRFAAGLKLVRLGLDYAAVDVVLRRMCDAAGLFDDVRTMESAALGAFAEASE